MPDQQTTSTPQSQTAEDTRRRIRRLVDTHWSAFSGDCSGLVKAVATDLGFALTGNANAVADYLAKNVSWREASSAAEAARLAESGYFVIAAKSGERHGHLAIVHGPNAKRPDAPIGSWGQFGGSGMRETGLNQSWRPSDLASVRYYYVPLH